MKAILEDIPAIKGASSFYARRIVVPAFEFKWHFHPEYELTYILRGKGYRIVAILTKTFPRVTLCYWEATYLTLGGANWTMTSHPRPL